MSNKDIRANFYAPAWERWCSELDMNRTSGFGCGKRLVDELVGFGNGIPACPNVSIHAGENMHEYGAGWARNVDTDELRLDQWQDHASL